MKARRTAISLTVLTLALLGAAAADAGSQPTPVAGSYKGPAESFGYQHHKEIGPAYAKVSRASGKTSISLELYGQLDCGSDEGLVLQITVTAQTAGTTFSHTGVADDNNGVPLHYQLKGRFMKPTAFRGTLKGTGEYETFTSEKTSCSADINFTQYRAKPSAGGM